MRILLDTNILILRENNHTIPENLAKMLQLINGLENSSICVHHLSIKEIQKDKNIERQKINLSKINSYAVLTDYPNYEDDSKFVSEIPKPKTENDIIDNQLLYCAYKNVIDILITEDIGILNKAEHLNIEQVLNINGAIAYFKTLYTNTNINLLPIFKKVKGYEIDLNDPIFESLKMDYAGFINWWKEKVWRRELFIFERENKIKAILIPKIEQNEKIECTPELKREKILKICTFKVSDDSRGLKLGERLLKMAFDFAILNNVFEIYLTHYKQASDYLIPLLQSFGFSKYGENKDGEEIYLKKIIPDSTIDLKNKEDVTKINKTFYPAFYDGSIIKKHIIPIAPRFHERLFPDVNIGVRQLSLFEPSSGSEGNSIKKAYICNSNSHKVNVGDIILFYRSQDIKAITTIGTVESIYYNLRDAEQIAKIIAKRTVFSIEEIKEKCKSDVIVILFNQNFNLKQNYKYKDLKTKKIVNGYIQGITEIPNEKYKEIIEENIDERFIIH